MLVARKLLLADDSITIQKIVALTFADKGIEVIAVSDGAEAIEKLEETSPDIVLADVHMPARTGYQVCEYIKQTERLKHIPVMLMVGSFEPFDEVEARRVGADDILTKPFQSIRTLMDKVGTLLGRTPADHPEEFLSAPEVPPVEEAATAVPDVRSPILDFTKPMSATGERSPEVSKEAETQELPPPEVIQPPEKPMTTEELELTTADTQRLSPEIRDRVKQFVSERVRVGDAVLETDIMHTHYNAELSRETAESSDDSLLDLDQFEPDSFNADEDVILDIDYGTTQYEAASAVPAYSQTGVAFDRPFESPVHAAFASPVTETPAEFAGQSFQTGELGKSTSATGTSGVSVPIGSINPAQLSPEVIDAIARRVVEQLSEKVVQEIAWEVVPQLAELMIKRRLEEQEAGTK